jgi:hypothetical protein
VSTTAIIVSLIMAAGALVLASRGLGGVPRDKLVRYALIWGVIILGLVLLLRLAGA